MKLEELFFVLFSMPVCARPGSECVCCACLCAFDKCVLVLCDSHHLFFHALTQSAPLVFG